MLAEPVTLLVERTGGGPGADRLLEVAVRHAGGKNGDEHGEHPENPKFFATRIS